ncbi:hypothetical protein ACLRDI_30580 [Pseudomonas piscis]|uniref:hypothetical protein n=1 Tax=Pseudomonas piscis TaxID=2614538 RepID=UPI0039A4C89E
MSDEDNQTRLPRPPLSVSSDDFVRFLEANSSDADCPVCGKTEWTIICPFTEGSDTYRLVTSLKDGHKPMNVSTFALYCDHCGYFRQHLAKVVKKWVDNNPQNPELDFGASDADELDRDD